MKLKSGFEFEIERLEDRVRLIVTEKKSEIVCRKESIKKLVEFISGSEKEIFKGRLRLKKSSKGISIIVKGFEIGVISKRNLIRLCQNAI